MTPEQYRDEHDDEPEDMVQCHSCKEWWPEDAGEVYASDWCVDNENAYCFECRQEMNE